MEEFFREVHKLARPFRVTNGDGFRLKDIDPGDTLNLKSGDKPRAKEVLAAGIQAMDAGHSEQVTTLALALFDELRSLHGYGATERRLLEIASRLHDIGWSRAVSGKHHKLSRDLILELDIPGLGEQDRLLCALMARYPRSSSRSSFW